MKVPVKTVRGLKISIETGLEESGHPDAASTSGFLYAEPGDKLSLLDSLYEINVLIYLPVVEDKWVHTYDYSPNQAWVVYEECISIGASSDDEYIFKEKKYFRLCIRRVDGADLSGGRIDDVLTFEKRDVLRFALLADSHYVVNGTWDTTVAGIWAANRDAKLDGIIHLGDLTDGMLSKEMCQHYANLVLGDLRSIGLPVLVALGNHDYNYFWHNPDKLSEHELSELYLGGGSPRYTADFSSHKLRLIFLDSFDPDRELKYGYSDECIRWSEDTLSRTPKDWNVIILSHLTPLSRLHAWSNHIHGEAELMKTLTAHSSKILAFINGHQHTDHLCNDEAFPIVSVGCAKCEHFTEHKPEGAVTAERALGTKTQELWDILVVDSAAKTLRFERQGSGKDRIVRNAKAEWVD